MSESLREVVVRSFQFGRAANGLTGGLIHTGENLRNLATQRGLRLRDVVSIACVACGAFGNANPSFGLGFGHWPECDGHDTDLRFLRPSTKPKKES